MAKIDKESTLTKTPEYILYDELIMLSKKAAYVKCNIVSKIPEEVLITIRNKIKPNIPVCFQKGSISYGTISDKKKGDRRKGDKKRKVSKKQQKKRKLIKTL